MSTEHDNCNHIDFEAWVEISRIEDINRFMADIKIRCTVCGEHFLFSGLPKGLDLYGCSVSFDGKEARLAIYPESENPRSPMGI